MQQASKDTAESATTDLAPKLAALEAAAAEHTAHSAAAQVCIRAESACLYLCWQTFTD